MSLEFYKHCGVFESDVKVKVTQSCPTLCDPMDYTIHGILQARILEWVAIPFSRGYSQPRHQTQVFHIAAGRFFSKQLSHKESPRILDWVAYPFSSGSSWPRKLGFPALQVNSLQIEL